MKKASKKTSRAAAKAKAPAKKAAPKKAVKNVVRKAAPKKAAKAAPKKAAKKITKKIVKAAPQKAAAKAAPKKKPAAKKSAAPKKTAGKAAQPASRKSSRPVSKNVSQGKAVVVSSLPAQSAVKAPKPAQSKHARIQQAAPDTSGRKRLNKEELKYFENLLNEKKETLMQELDYIEDNAMRLNSKDGAGDLSSHAYHLADHATETQDREQAFHLASREGRFLYYIEEALDRVRAGTFGICKKCGTLIPKARLEAVPTAKMCINCKSQQEQVVEGE